MVTVTRTYTVGAPMPTVVEFLKDFQTTEQWDPGTISCPRVDSGEIKVGSRWHNTSTFRGRETELDYELVNLEASRLTFVGKNKTATSTDDLRFGPAGPTSTTITYQATIDFHGLAKLAGPFLKGAFEKLGDQVVVKMTGVLESLPVVDDEIGS